jgi:hypothetical protein
LLRVAVVAVVKQVVGVAQVDYLRDMQGLLSALLILLLLAAAVRLVQPLPLLTDKILFLTLQLLVRLPDVLLPLAAVVVVLQEVQHLHTLPETVVQAGALLLMTPQQIYLEQRVLEFRVKVMLAAEMVVLILHHGQLLAGVVVLV